MLKFHLFDVLVDKPAIFGIGLLLHDLLSSLCESILKKFESHDDCPLIISGSTGLGPRLWLPDGGVGLDSVCNGN